MHKFLEQQKTGMSVLTAKQASTVVHLRVETRFSYTSAQAVLILANQLLWPN